MTRNLDDEEDGGRRSEKIAKEVMKQEGMMTFLQYRRVLLLILTVNVISK